jgi:AraC-like DNA-binding protein
VPAATPDTAAAYALAALVDLDDFTVETAARGQLWARRQVAVVAAAIDSALPPTARSRAEPPDEWMLVFEEPDPTRALAAAERAATPLQGELRRRADVTATISIGRPCRGDFAAAEAAARRTNARKLVVGGDRIIWPDDAVAPAQPPIRIEHELRPLVRAGNHAGASALLARWLDRCARQPGSTPEQLRQWLFGELLYVVDIVRSDRLADGSADWLAACAQLPLSELAAVHQIHERSYLRLWLDRTLAEIITGAGPAPLEPLVARAERYLAANYHQPSLQLRTVAAAISVSPFHIAHLFQRERGTTFLRHLTGLRMRAARGLLTETPLPIEAVAHRVGYRSAKQFRDVFKREVGATPTDYRARARRPPG